MKARKTTAGDRKPAGLFDRLKQWEHYGRAVEIFEQDLNRPIQETKSAFDRNLYEALIDRLLDWMEMPRASSSREWEWRELYRFGREANPHYISEGMIHRMLARWPAFDFRQRRTIVSILTGFFQLRRSGFPANFPSPPPADQRRFGPLGADFPTPMGLELP